MTTIKHGSVNQEPLYGCTGCYELRTFPASDLRVHDHECWCYWCWDEYEAELGIEYADLPVYEPQPAPDMTPWEELDFSKMTRRQLVVYSGQQNFKITHLQAHNEQLNAKVRRQKDALRQVERKPTPDASALVDLLRDIGDVCRQLEMPSERAIAEWADRIDAALAAHRKKRTGAAGDAAL